MEETVLIYLEKDNKYLMLFRNKKEHDLNEGKYIGIGGHIEPNESKEEALIREVKEETNLDLISYAYRAKLLFINDDFQEIMHLYTSSEFTGVLDYKCNEGELYWIDKNAVCSLPLWDGDKAFLSLFNGLEDKSVPSVMKYFKMNYAGQVDMSIVNRVLRSL